MIGLKKIKSLESYLSGFRWKNYQREFRKPNDLKNLYWNIVYLDYLDSTYHDLNDGSYSLFSDRVQTSFMGTFYKPHEIIVKWEHKLDGFSQLYISENQREWNSLISEAKHNYVAEFSILWEYIHRYTENYTAKHQNDTSKGLNLTKFDSKHKNIEQVVSRILSKHIAETRYATENRYNALKNFPISLPVEIIDQTHEQADSYFRSRFVHWFLKNFTSRLPSERPYTTIKCESIPKAFDQLLVRYPKWTELGKKPLTELIDLYCKDKNGEKFERASIRAFLRRKGFE